LNRAGDLEASAMAMNIGRMALATATQHPDLLAVVTDRSMLTYDQLARLVRSFTARMQALGVGPGSRVELDSGDVTVAAPVILGCALLGAAWVSVGAARHLPERLRPTHVLTDKFSAETDGRHLITSEWTTSAPADPMALEPVSDRAPFIYAPTSGTTGAPKILVLSQHQQALRAHATRDDFVTRQTVFCTFFHADAYPFITRFLSAFVNGATVVQSHDPAVWYAAGVNHLYGSVAQIGTAMAGKVLPRKLPLVHVSGARLSDELALHLLQSFDSVVDLYASTETNRSFKNVRFIDGDGHLAVRGVQLDSKVEIADDNGQAVPQGTVGFVRVQNDYLADGYLDNPEATATSFRDGWFYTGDLGFFGPLGELQVVGRSGDILNLGGVKVNAMAIDDALRAVEGVSDAMCFDVPVPGKANELLAFVVPAAGVSMTDIADRVRLTVQPRFGAQRSPQRLIEISAVPRAHDGGAQRFMCRTLYQTHRNG
jgi:acyl-coenzyme A synthetase/AMP-(fatty) acid ligase